MKNFKFYFIIFSCCLIANPASGYIEIDEEEEQIYECQQKGGSLKEVCSIGFLCIITNPDAGKPCRSSSDCQNSCVVKSLISKPSKPLKNKFKHPHRRKKPSLDNAKLIMTPAVVILISKKAKCSQLFVWINHGRFYYSAKKLNTIFF